MTSQNHTFGQINSQNVAISYERIINVIILCERSMSPRVKFINCMYAVVSSQMYHFNCTIWFYRARCSCRPLNASVTITLVIVMCEVWIGWLDIQVSSGNWSISWKEWGKKLICVYCVACNCPKMALAASISTFNQFRYRNIASNIRNLNRYLIQVCV